MLNLSLSIAAGGVKNRNVCQHYASWWHHGKATVVNRKFPTWESTLSYTYSTFFLLLLFLLFLFLLLLLEEFIQLQMHCHSHAPFALNCTRTHIREHIMLIVVDIAVYCNSLPNKAADSFQILEANLWAQMQECWSVGIYWAAAFQYLKTYLYLKMHLYLEVYFHHASN